MKLTKRVARVEAAAAAAADAALVFSVNDAPLERELAEGEHLAVDLGRKLARGIEVRWSRERASRVEGDFGTVTDLDGVELGLVYEIIATPTARLIYWAPHHTSRA